MNIKSCKNCGVVLDFDELSFPPDIWKEAGDIDSNLGIWDGDDYVAYLPCPVCKEPLPENS